jgi:hypothetical protein
VLLPLALGEAGPDRALSLAAAGLPIEGIDAGLDTESVDWTAPDQIALGTEAHREGASADVVLIAHLSPDRGRFVVRQRLAVPYALWGTTTRSNQGIEGLCSASGHLFLAIEAALAEGQRRYAPIARLSMADGSVKAWRLRLSSETGKLSALACRPGPTAGTVAVRAIERHHGVARLLYFSLPLPSDGIGASVSPEGAAPPPVIEPSDSADLLAVFDGDPPNLEGLAWFSDGAVLLVSDNHTGSVTGPTEAVLLPASSVSR